MGDALRGGEPRDATRSDSTMRFIVGIVLVVVGLGIFLEQVSGIDLSFVTFVVGAGLLAAWSRTRMSGLLIAGGIVSGAGLGFILSGLVIPQFQDAVELASIAAGFAMIGVLSRRKPLWPWIVAGALTVIAALGLIDTSYLIPAAVSRLGLPIVIVLAGLVLLTRDRLPLRVSRTILVILTVIGIVLLSAGDGANGL